MYDWTVWKSEKIYGKGFNTQADTSAHFSFRNKLVGKGLFPNIKDS